MTPPSHAVIVLVGRLPRLAAAQRLVGGGHRRQPLEDERELDRQRRLAPQRAVVVERGDAFLRGDEVRSVTCHPRDVVGDRLPGRGVVPRCQEVLVGHDGPTYLALHGRRRGRKRGAERLQTKEC